MVDGRVRPVHLCGGGHDVGRSLKPSVLMSLLTMFLLLYCLEYLIVYT